MHYTLKIDHNYYCVYYNATTKELLFELRSILILFSECINSKKLRNDQYKNFVKCIGPSSKMDYRMKWFNLCPH